MNIYVYNSSTINEYSVDDCGLISSSPMEVFDCGKLNESEYIDEIENYSSIVYTETILPFGSIRIKQNNKTECKKISSFFRKLDEINNKSIIFAGIVIRWYGFGTIFEINNGLVRQVVPDVSGGGTLK